MDEVSMDTKAFSFNRQAKYLAGAQATTPEVSSDALTKPHIQVGSDGFQTQYPDVFEKYCLPNISSDKLVQAWNSNPMQFWQNQVNFAIWCATTGCGVSAQDHLAAKDPMMQSLYFFHVYYVTRRILDEIQAKLPQDRAWSATNNPYDRVAYERICNEFGVSSHTDWRIKGPNNGLGRVYFYATNVGYRPVYGPGDPNYFDPARMSFTKQTSNSVLHVDFIKQDTLGADQAWKTFILDRSEGFTRPGVERLNDSIRTYVWAILGAQAQTRTGILGSGTAFDAQKQFLANVEDAISSPVDLPSAISRYQDVLRYAGSEVNFVFGFGLYMAPSDMLLRVGRFMGYNNKIVIVSGEQKLGVNVGVNTSDEVPPDIKASNIGNVKMTGTAGLVEPPQTSTILREAAHVPQEQSSKESGANPDHEDEKTALIVGGVAVGLAVLWFAALRSRSKI
jgi:hypothetical protein